ncbi:unnamed protein product [Porites lobata]|uniref:guanylate cyclase n=1 Tax=Porites lobata TaxID=104759 RepID=A0ABN8NDU2_9CNID|nr:unnamed protein product [Porites lobata]
MTGRWPIGTRIAAAVPMAIFDITNDSNLLPGYNITYNIVDSSCEPEKGLRGMVAFKTADLFIGPACSVVAEPTALLAKIWNKPIVTYAASSNKFINKYIYSTLSTITAYARRSEKYTPKFVLQILKEFDWNILAIVSSSEVEWKTMAEKIRSTIEPSAKVSMFENYDNKYPQFERILQKGKDVSRVFLILCYINEVLDIMKTAERLGMTKGDYAFITLDLNTDVFYKDGQWSGNQGKGSKLPIELNGIIDLSIYRPEIYEEFKMKYETMKNTLDPVIRSKLYLEVSWYSSFLYDAVYLYSLAVNDTLTHGYDVTNTTEIITRMFNRHFYGKSGHIFMENGTRVPQFVVGNLRAGSYKFIGNKTKIFRNSTGPIYHQLHLFVKSKITWPGGSSNAPLSEPLCGFTGEKCNEDSKDTLVLILGIVGACLLVLIIFVLLICVRRRAKGKESIHTKWMINCNEIAPADDTEDHPMVLGNLHHMNSSEGLRSTQGSAFNVLPFASSARLLSDGGFLQRRLSKGIYRGKSVLVKKVSEGISHLTENMKIEIRQACEIRHVNLNPYVGICAEFPDVLIVSEYCAKGSLQDILLNETIKLDWTFRMSFASDIARGMEELHKTSIGCHGNLKSTNVLVDSYWICKVADHGLHSFRENKLITEERLQCQSALFWTAPEHLRSTADIGKSQPGDVYSYGIMLQEIALREKPFSTSLLCTKEILYHVRKSIQPHCRPQVPPDSAPRPYIDLMKICWDESPERRPTFSGILKILKKINNGKTISVIDNMLLMMEKYTNNLESLVNERTKQLQCEKTKTDELLHKMLPRSIAEQLKAGLEVKAEQYDNVTIFYSDIDEFSNITSASSPIQVITLLNDLHSLYDTVMTRYDVYKVETSSDSCLVVSGLPERNGNKHAGHIARMSLRLVTYLKEFKISHLPGRTLQFRIGIHSGPCVAGVVGLKKPRYEIFGEIVNIAKQLEESCAAQRIHVSSSCKLILDDLGSFHLEERGLVKIKGLGETKTFYLTETYGNIKQKMTTP